MEKFGKFIKGAINYLGFYLVVIALICKPNMDILFTLVNGEFNLIGQALVDMAGEGFYFFGFMFIPIITIGCHALFGFLDDAIGFSPKTAVTVGLISSLILTIVQAILRIGYDNYSFIMYYHDYENYFVLSSILEYRILSNIYLVATGLLGFSIYSFFVSGASYEYIEITTYYNDSGFEYDSKTSDTKYAIWLHVVLGLATTIIPIFLANSPLIIFVLLLCLVLSFKHKNKERFIIKSVILTICGLLVMTPIILTETNVITPNTITYDWINNYEEENDKTIKVIKVNYNLESERIVLPDNYHGISVKEYKNGILEGFNNLKYLEYAPTIGQHVGELFTTNIHKDKSLYNRYIPKTLEELYITNTETIYTQFLTGCDTIKKIQITDSVKFIYQGAISDNDSLIFNQYENGNYIGTKDNPYYALINVIDTNVVDFKVHNDTVVIAGGATNYLYNLKTITLPKSVKYLIAFEFLSNGCNNVEKLYYEGSKEDAKEMKIVHYGYDNIQPLPEDRLNKAYIYFYSETKPTEEGNYWHYDTDNVTPIIWSNE